MIIFPNIKINLGLWVEALRPDGYHNITSLFYPVPWRDALEIVAAETLQLSLSGIPIPGEKNENLCLKAYRLLADDFALPPVHIHLHKTIPTGAGLGGGSADAAFTLKLLNRLFSLGLDKAALARYALLIGSDCPFFIENRPALAGGRGEILQPFAEQLAEMYLQIVCPPIHISTKEAYRNLQRSTHKMPFKKIVEMPIRRWKTLLHNDFETWAVAAHPQIGVLKRRMYQRQKALYAAMSGSGSAVFGIFSEKPPKFPTADGHTIWSGKIEPAEKLNAH